jgi:hypothetical protein
LKVVPLLEGRALWWWGLGEGEEGEEYEGKREHGGQRGWESAGGENGKEWLLLLSGAMGVLSLPIYLLAACSTRGLSMLFADISSVLEKKAHASGQLGDAKAARKHHSVHSIGGIVWADDVGRM